MSILSDMAALMGSKVNWETGHVTGCIRLYNYMVVPGITDVKSTYVRTYLVQFYYPITPNIMSGDPDR